MECRSAYIWMILVTFLHKTRDSWLRDNPTLMWSANLVQMTHKWAYQGAVHRFLRLCNKLRFDWVPWLPQQTIFHCLSLLSSEKSVRWQTVMWLASDVSTRMARPDMSRYCYRVTGYSRTGQQDFTTYWWDYSDLILDEIQHYFLGAQLPVPLVWNFFLRGSRLSTCIFRICKGYETLRVFGLVVQRSPLFQVPRSKIQICIGATASGQHGLNFGMSNKYRSFYIIL